MKAREILSRQKTTIFELPRGYQLLRPADSDDWLERLLYTWERYLEEARDEYPFECDELVETVAENRMVNAGLAPPAWEYSATCRECGVMPCSWETRNTILVSCPWCHSETWQAQLNAMPNLREKNRRWYELEIARIEGARTQARYETQVVLEDAARN